MPLLTFGITADAAGPGSINFSDILSPRDGQHQTTLSEIFCGNGTEPANEGRRSSRAVKVARLG